MDQILCTEIKDFRIDFDIVNELWLLTGSCMIDGHHTELALKFSKEQIVKFQDRVIFGNLPGRIPAALGMPPSVKPHNFDIMGQCRHCGVQLDGLSVRLAGKCMGPPEQLHYKVGQGKPIMCAACGVRVAGAERCPFCGNRLCVFATNEVMQGLTEANIDGVIRSVKAKEPEDQPKADLLEQYLNGDKPKKVKFREFL